MRSAGLCSGANPPITSATRFSRWDPPYQDAAAIGPFGIPGSPSMLLNKSHRGTRQESKRSLFCKKAPQKTFAPEPVVLKELRPQDKSFLVTFFQKSNGFPFAYFLALP
jgi:hypothetical protein